MQIEYRVYDLQGRPGPYEQPDHAMGRKLEALPHGAASITGGGELNQELRKREPQFLIS
jgi:hypothetical protein